MLGEGGWGAKIGESDALFPSTPFKLGSSQFLDQVSQRELHMTGRNIIWGGNNFQGKYEEEKNPSTKAPVLASRICFSIYFFLFFFIPVKEGGSSATKRSSSVRVQLHIVGPGWVTDSGSAQLSHAPPADGSSAAAGAAVKGALLRLSVNATVKPIRFLPSK